MKKIDGLDALLKPLTKRDLKAELVPTLRDIIVESVGRRKPDNFKQGNGFYKLADKLIAAKDSIELEDIEYETVQDSVKDNPTGYFPYYLGQVMEILK